MDPYRNIASVYDAFTASFLQGPRAEIVRSCRELGAGRILDVGCGTGILARMLREQGATIVGLDASAAMLNERREGPGNQRGAAAPSSLLVLGDAERLPFRPRSFDILIYALILHETASDAEKLLRAGFSLAPRVLALEWRLPERNLDYCLRFWVPLIERLAGKEHYRHYRAYMRSGGIRGLAWRAGADVVWEKPLRGNSLSLCLLQQKS